ncbi:hypothetical protein WT21_16940 [Burkholderia territorii]|uniref:hypothetical protein n=1 Tax=Burkholderia territorii TaxID=1503055 RepID=UPI00075DBC1F|nr:hypothetical protein [Burkholderia territorii]AOI67378.1 hypothetical protein WS51_27110 [Burkholderia territorii]KUY85360.1 hypothetical protein WS47_27680 [Burkholderia territorii]KUZ21775.1 hypothetical protein WS50_06255 [Burkholderia territorii]KVG57834.1 hypothetical protein WS79_17135 [Burkholderia territorii]KVQ47039.1 hypothetical protein WT21_16940 [Burkholderia territorii]
MNAASNMRQTNDAASTDERRGGEQRTVAPTRTRARVRARTARDAGRRPERGSGNGPVAPSGRHETGEPHWEDDGGEMPPEEWS